MPRRVRHHTDDAGLEGIRRMGSIKASRGWMNIESGVHVEVEPFGTTRSARPGEASPKNDMDCAGEGAYVEFDAPESMIEYEFSGRNTAIIPLGPDETLCPLSGLNPEFVKVRRHIWEFWRRRPE